MSELPDAQALNNAKISRSSSGDISHSPVGSPILNKFLVPSPVPTRRNRTYSASEKALQSQTYKGKVKEFCRQKGHGFIIKEGTGETIFVHISDVEGEYVPKQNDDVTFKELDFPINPKKKQAVHVNITHLAPGVSHETWTALQNPIRSPKV